VTEAERTIETPDDTPAADADGQRGEPAVSRGRRRIGVLAAVAVTAYLLDLASKIMVVVWLERREEISVLGEWLTLHAVRNSGAAFGMGQALTIVFTCVATIVVLAILRLARKLYSVPWAIALGLLLGGALGNLTDRIFRDPGVFEGAVVDFIAPKHFAVFNLADSAIVCGGILIVLLSFRGLDPDGTVQRAEPDADAGAGEDGGSGGEGGPDRRAASGAEDGAEDGEGGAGGRRD
jgi:signal peptidase II